MSEGVAELRDRIAALEQHISDLEKSLANARKDLESAIAERDQERGIRVAAQAHNLEEKRAADTYRKRMEEVQDELARLKPSGQVAEDRDELMGLFLELRAHRSVEGWHAAIDRHAPRITRLAAKAQGYEAIRKALSDNYGTDGDPLERVKDLLESEEAARNEAAVEQAERHRVEEERDAAVADNAALVEWIDQNGHARWCERAQGREFRCTEGCAAQPVTLQPHPGAALLERMKNVERELEMVRKGEVCPHEMPLQRIAETISKPGELLSAHDVAERVLERLKRLEAAAAFTLKTLRAWHKDKGDWATCQTMLGEALDH